MALQESFGWRQSSIANLHGLMEQALPHGLGQCQERGSPLLAFVCASGRALGALLVPTLLVLLTCPGAPDTLTGLLALQ